ncbi:prolyl aminopeptidase [Rhizobium sp. BK376]|nr:prolyl aminopeptidase [Rhizobium sp. BK376]
MKIPESGGGPRDDQMKRLYPEIEPYDHGMLEVGDGNSIYWALSGNPKGISAIVLHGGPGSGSSANMRRFFDPQHYRIIQFDQRGCGKSQPNAADPQTDMSVNTTWHLVRDMERLRIFFGVERWLVFGHSWGCTLALVYAQQHAERIAGLVVAGITMTRQSEIDWLYHGMAVLLPQEWSRFRAGVPEEERDGHLVTAYHRLLQSPDPDLRLKAATSWHEWEGASILVDPDATLPRRWADPGYLLMRARIIAHYFHHRGWLTDSQILKEAHRLAGIRGVMVHGRMDLEAPLVTAWELSQAWPEAKLVVVPRSAHSPSSAGMAAAIVDATDSFRNG